MPPTLAALVWLEPAWLAGLALPALLLLLATAPARPREVPAGTYRIWCEVAGEADGRTGGRRPPVATWLAALGAALGALALARPVRLGPAEIERWTVVVDRSPSTGLEWIDPATGEGSGRSRLEVAAGRLADLVARHEQRRGVSVELVWSAPDLAPGDADGRALPPSLRAPARRAFPAPDWDRLDLPLHLWLADTTPSPARAWACLSGGGPVPGLVASGADVAFAWRGGDGLDEVPAPPERRVVAVDDGLPESVAGIAREWAGLRGLAVTGTTVGADTALALDAVGREEPRPAARLGRDGWTARARVRTYAGAAGREPWLVAPDGAIVVDAGPGAIGIAAATLDVDRTLGAPFAASWGALLDGALTPAEDVAALDERRAAGPPRTMVPGAAPDAGGGSDDRRSRSELAPWLAALAALLAAGAALAAARAARAR